MIMATMLMIREASTRSRAGQCAGLAMSSSSRRLVQNVETQSQVMTMVNHHRCLIVILIVIVSIIWVMSIARNNQIDVEIYALQRETEVLMFLEGLKFHVRLDSLV